MSALVGEVHFSQNAPTSSGGRAYARVSSRCMDIGAYM